MMTPEQEALVDRLRVRLAGLSSVREVPMFGGRSFMVNERLVVSAQKDGSLLVRVAPGRGGVLMDEDGARQAEMKGRSMGPSWITVDAEAISGEAGLSHWVDEALAHNLSGAPDPAVRGEVP